MKLCLAFMFKNEYPLLHLHLPIWAQCDVDGIVATDGGSRDNSRDLVLHYGADVFDQRPQWPPRDWENDLVMRAEEMGYDAILKLDPDELIFPADVGRIRRMLETEWDACYLPRYNFMGDRLHYAAEKPFYPDPQLRAWKLNRGVRYQGEIDSVPDAQARGLRVRYCDDIHLYHYCFIKPMPEYLRKRVPLERRVRGEEYNSYIPPQSADYPACPVPFTGKQPLDPLMIGARAPYA